VNKSAKQITGSNSTWTKTKSSREPRNQQKSVSYSSIIIFIGLKPSTESGSVMQMQT